MLSHLGAVKEIEFVASEPSSEVVTERTSLLTSKLYIIDDNPGSDLCTFYLPSKSATTHESMDGDEETGNSQKIERFQIPKSIVSLYTDDVFPPIGTRITNKDTIQNIIQAAGTQLAATADTGPAWLRHPRASHYPNPSGRAFQAFVGAVAGAIGGEALEVLFRPLNNIDDKIPVPFWMVTAFFGVLLSLYCRHYVQHNDNSVTSCLKRWGSFGQKDSTRTASLQTEEQFADRAHHTPAM